MPIMVADCQLPSPSCEIKNIYILRCLFPLEYLRIVVRKLTENCQDSGKQDGCHKQSPVPPSPLLSFWEGPRILRKLRDVVIQIVEYPLYILSSLNHLS
jgi:hypothetical protein